MQIKNGFIRSIHTKVVVGRVVEQDNTDSKNEASHSRSHPVKVGVGGPGEDEKTSRDTPASPHHGNQTLFGWRLATVCCADLKIVLVDNRSKGCAKDDTDSQRDKHETGIRRAPSFATLVNNWVARNIVSL